MDECARWYADNAETTLHRDYPLTPQSIVFDVGGNIGNLAQILAKLYDPHIFCFEPVFEFANVCADKFLTNPKVLVFNYGLWDSDCQKEVAINDIATGVYCTYGDRRMVEFRDAAAIARPFDNVDLITLNCEGGEYHILPRLIETEEISKFKYVQIQFHDVIPKAREKMEAIRQNLSKTHKQSWCYDFVWESWERL